MTVSFETIAATRFGFGLSPNGRAPSDIANMLAALRAGDETAAQLPVRSFPDLAVQEKALGALRKARRKQEAGAEETFKAANLEALKSAHHDMRISLLRAAMASDGFRERLVRFWADHFSVSAKGKGLRYVTTGYIEDAIRPNITGSFSNLLRAATTHPVMLIYLDQIQSIGPNSKIGLKAGRGLNENLAREILELHTLGVGGAYGQTDVREFAELLTGLNYNFRTGFNFRKQAAEPGAELVLGREYGGRFASLSDIYEALEDLSLHPDTGQHLARKLVVHFVSDTPDEAHIAEVASAYRASRGDLMATYEALLSHPAAWRDPLRKAKQPFDFMASSMRAMGVDASGLENLSRKKSRFYFLLPMQLMGQPWLEAAGPDGWPESTADWITPQGLAARVQWALLAAGLWAGDTDPRAFAKTALGELADSNHLRLVGFSESRLEGVALTLASPAFNRR